MINVGPIMGLVHGGTTLLAVCCGSILGTAIGLPIKRRIIRRWVVRK